MTHGHFVFINVNLHLVNESGQFFQAREQTVLRSFWKMVPLVGNGDPLAGRLDTLQGLMV